MDTVLFTVKLLPGIKAPLFSSSNFNTDLQIYVMNYKLLSRDGFMGLFKKHEIQCS